LATEDTTQRPQLTDVAEDDEATLGLRGRRRPAGQLPYPYSLEPSGWVWVGLAAVPVIVWLWYVATGTFPPGVVWFDATVLSAALRVRTPTFTSFARVVALLGAAPTILFLRWGTILVLAAFRRGRHLATFVGVVLGVRLLVILLVQVVGRPRPWGVGYLIDWSGFAHPSAVVAAFSAAVVGLVFSLVPAERRRWAWIAATAAIVALVAARVYAGVDHPSDGILAAILATAIAVVAMRIYCPDEIFPVVYRRRKGAHLDLEGERGDRLRAALREQVDLQVEDIEPFGLEGSGGSTPLRIRGRALDERDRPGEEVTLFGKLYSASHLRADRWIKVWRTIVYGALEDEAAFNSVRQLVEYEDYMLRVMNDGGVPTVEPRGIVEVITDREYLILMTFLGGADEADEAPAVDDRMIESGLELIQTLWSHGLAHRDIKPANVLVKHDRVHVIDVAFGQIRPSGWRQAVDLANMMLVLALASDAERVHGVARRRFTAEELGEAFAATRGVTIPRGLRSKLKEDGRDLLEQFRRLVPEHDPIGVQRWDVRRVAVTVRTVVLALALAGLVLVNLANPSSP
jgi:tRNA A-37 threonylcarbamoyl transferase component Bud32/membrane-associated phospholipid phosphatase